LKIKEQTFSSLEEVLNSMMENASKTFELRKEDFEKVIFPKVKKMKVYDKDTKQEAEVSIYRDVMFREEYTLDDAELTKESGIVLTKNFELAKLEIIHLKCSKEETEKAYLSEIELSDIPMLALFIESLEIDLPK
jgi:uncharacterized protein YfeS